MLGLLNILPLTVSRDLIFDSKSTSLMNQAYLIGVFFDNPSPGYVTDVQLGAIARCRQEG